MGGATGVAAARLVHAGIVWLSLCAAVVFSQTATGSGACTASNKADCCMPDGTQYCVQLETSAINITDGICVWTNLAGQTPDKNSEYNSPYINNFACGGSDGGCNYASTSAIANGNNYYAMVPGVNGSATEYDTSTGAETAKGYYENFNVALSRYNCEEQYSHWNCDDCRKAYARWACAMTYPACTTSPCGTVKPCVRVCNEVVQKCPVTLGFTCPDDNRDYSDSSCNYMGLVAGAASVPASISAVVVSVGLAIAFARQH